MHKPLPPIQTCKFIHVTDLAIFFAPGYFNEFLERLSDNKSITWGDANRTMISVERFNDAVTELVDDGVKIKHINDLNSYLNELETNEVYIDFEN